MHHRLLTALLAAALLTAACGTDGAEDGAAPAPSPPTTAGPTTAAPSPADDGVTADDVRQAVRDWFAALADGDVDAAYSALAPASQEQVGGREGFERSQSELSEGFGAYATADPDLVVTELPGGDRGVVTVVGEVTREGMTEVGVNTLPYRLQDGDVRLDPFARAGGRAEFAELGSQLVVFVPAATEPYLSLDGELLDLQTEGADGDQTRLTATPSGDQPGPDVVTAIWVDREGRAGADAELLPSE